MVVAKIYKERGGWKKRGLGLGGVEERSRWR